MEKWRISGSNISRSEKDLGNWTEEMRICSFVIHCLLCLRVKENVYILCKVTFFTLRKLLFRYGTARISGHIVNQRLVLAAILAVKA